MSVICAERQPLGPHPLATRSGVEALMLEVHVARALDMPVRGLADWLRGAT